MFLNQWYTTGSEDHVRKGSQATIPAHTLSQNNDHVYTKLRNEFIYSVRELTPISASPTYRVSTRKSKVTQKKNLLSPMHGYKCNFKQKINAQAGAGYMGHCYTKSRPG